MIDISITAQKPKVDGYSPLTFEGTPAVRRAPAIRRRLGQIGSAPSWFAALVRPVDWTRETPRARRATFRVSSLAARFRRFRWAGRHPCPVYQ
jgi:hypothetical protein